jgi:hypothetical protein
MSALFRLLWRAYAVLFLVAGAGGILIYSAGKHVQSMLGQIGAALVLVTMSLMIALVPLLMLVGALVGWKKYRREVLGIESTDEGLAGAATRVTISDSRRAVNKHDS